VAACALALLAAGGANTQDEKKPSRTAEDKPSAEAVKLLRLGAKEAIKKYDTDKDGKLSWKETQALFARFDKNSDGSLDSKELADAVNALAGKQTKADQHVIAFLREYDVDKDGKLSSKEARVLFDGADTDKDGALDENEVVAAVALLLPGEKGSKPTTETKPRPSTTETPPAAKTRRLVSLLGVRVVLGRDDALGKVVDVVIDGDGRVAYVVVRDADSLIAVPWAVVSYAAESKSLTVTERVQRTNLKGVTFAEGRYPDFASETWHRAVKTAWGERALKARTGPGNQAAPKQTDRKTDDKREKAPPRKDSPGKQPPKKDKDAPPKDR